jgi:hypothetical protein
MDEGRALLVDFYGSKGSGGDAVGGERNVDDTGEKLLSMLTATSD